MIFFNNIILYIIYPILIIYFLQFLTVKILKKKFTKVNYHFANILIIIILIALISNLTQIILLIKYDFFYQFKEEFKYILITILIATPIITLYQKKEFILTKNFLKLNNNLSKENIIFKFFLIIIFLSAVGIVSDADSLIYNSKISKLILSGFHVSYFIDNIHISLLGTMEIFNIYQEILNVTNLNRILNIFIMANFIVFVSTYFENYKNKNLFLLSIFSIPLLAIILTHEKTYFIPIIVQFSIFLLLLTEKKIDDETKLLIILGLFASSLYKLNFILTGSIIFIYFLIKFQKNFFCLNLIKKIFLSFIIIIFPLLLFKYILFGNPFNPVLNGIFNSIYNENINNNFSSYINEWMNNGSLIFPLNLFIPGSISNIHNTLGLGLIAFLCIKNIYSKKNMEIVSIFLLLTIFIAVFIQHSPRFFILPLMVLMSFLLFNEIKLKKFLTIFFVLQFLFTILVLSLMIPVTITTSWFDKSSEKYKNSYIFRYNINKQIDKYIGEDQFIITDLPNYYSKNFEISTMIMHLANNNEDLTEYKKFINNNNIKYMVTLNKSILETEFYSYKNKKIDNFFTKCFKKPYIKKFTVDVANRKKILLKIQTKNTFYLYKIEKNCKF